MRDPPPTQNHNSTPLERKKSQGYKYDFSSGSPELRVRKQPEPVTSKRYSEEYGQIIKEEPTRRSYREIIRRSDSDELLGIRREPSPVWPVKKKDIPAKYREANRSDGNRPFHAKDEDFDSEPRRQAITPRVKTPTFTPKINYRAASPQPPKLADSDDDGHEDFYKWVVNGSHQDMNKSKNLLFKKQN